MAFQITSTLFDDFSPAGSLNPDSTSVRDLGIEQEWRLEGEHGYAGVTDHVLGHAPQEHAGKPGATVRAQDDQAAVLLLGDPEDLRGSVPFDLDRLDGDTGVGGDEMFEPLLQALVEVGGERDGHPQLAVVDRRLHHVQEEQPCLVVATPGAGEPQGILRRLREVRRVQDGLDGNHGETSEWGHRGSFPRFGPPALPRRGAGPWPASGRGVDQVAEKPLLGQPGDLLQRPRLGEQVCRARDDLEFPGAAQLP